MSVKNFIRFYRILTRAYFHLPLLVFFLYELGYSFSQVISLILVYSVTSVIYLIIKQKITFKNIKVQLYYAEIFKIVGLLCFILFNSQIIILAIGQICLSLNYSIGIGLDTRIINENFNGETANEVQRNTNSLMFPSLLISGIIGAFSYIIDPTLPFLLTLICSFGIIFAILNTQINDCPTKTKKDPASNKSYTMLTLYYGITRGIVLTLFVALIPYLLLSHSVSIIEFVLILSSYTFCGFLSSKYYRKIKLTFNNKLIASIMLVFIGCIAVFINTVISIEIGLILFGFGGGLVRPITLEKISTPNAIKNLELAYFFINIVILIIMII